MKQIILLFSKSVFVLITCFFSLNSFAQLNGSFTVGGISADYVSIKAAIKDLKSKGINGPVEIDLSNGNYSENVVIDSIPGISLVNSVTIQAKSLKPNLVTLTGDSSVVFDIRIPYVKVKYISFKSSSSATNAFITLTETSDCIIDNCKFIQQTGSNYGIQSVGSTKAFNNVTISNSTFLTDVGFRIDAVNISNLSLLNNQYTVLFQANYIYADSSAQNITLSGLKVISSETAIYLEGANALVKNIIISYCTLESSNTPISIFSNEWVENITIRNSSISGDFPSNTFMNDGIHIEANGTKVRSILIKDIVINEINGYGIYISSNEETSLIKLENIDLHAENFGVYIAATNQPLRSVYLTGSKLYSTANYAYYLKGLAGIIDVQMQADTIQSPKGAVSIFADKGEINKVKIDQLTSNVIDSSICCVDAFLIQNNLNKITDCQIINSSFNGYVGLHVKSKFGIDSLVVSNSKIQSFKEGLYIENEYNEINKVFLFNSIFSSSKSSAVFMDGLNTSIKNSVIHASSLHGETGLKLTPLSGLNGLDIDNSLLQGKSDAAILYAGTYGGFSNFYVANSEILGATYGISITQNNQDISTVLIENNRIIADSSNSSGEGLQLYSDFSKLSNIVLKNNEIVAPSNIITFTANGGGVQNSLIHNNTISSSDQTINATLVKINNVGQNFVFTNNKMDTAQGGLGYLHSLSLDGASSFVNKVIVNENAFLNPVEYGVIVENITGQLEFKDNLLKVNSTTNFLNGLNITKVDSLEIAGNQFYVAKEANAIALDKVNQGRIYNNFFSGFNQFVYGGSIRNVLFAHNTFANQTSNLNNPIIEFGNGSVNNQFVNNLINVDSASYVGSIFKISNVSALGASLNNIYLFDTLKSSFVNDQFTGMNYVSLMDWQKATGKEKNSNLKDVQFIDEKNDLHVVCNQPFLQNGSAFIALQYDIDSNQRKTIPTIGADEFITNYSIFSRDTLFTCNLPIELNANSSAAYHYNWNTSDTTQIIFANSFSTYNVIVNDGCGNSSDSIVVSPCDKIAEVSSFGDDSKLWNVYPNPVIGSIKIQARLNSSEGELVITDAKGSFVLSEKIQTKENLLLEKTIDLTDFEQGIYFLKVIDRLTIYTEKIIKQ